MANTIPPYLEPTYDSPSPMVGQEGSTLLSAVCWPSYFGIGSGEEVETVRLDFYSPTQIDRETLFNRMWGLQAFSRQHGRDLVAYGLYRSTAFDIPIPNQVCVMGHCWTPPWAGQRVATMYHYRLWVLWREIAVSPSIRAAWPALGVVIAVGVLLILGIALVAGVWSLTTGKVTWPEIAQYTKDILKSPGENVAGPITAAAWPMVAMGFALVASSIALPLVVRKAEFGLAGGPFRTALELGSPGYVAPIEPPRRRS
jgi:hypothetical protein